MVEKGKVTTGKGLQKEEQKQWETKERIHQILLRKREISRYVSFTYLSLLEDFNLISIGSIY